MIEDKEIWACAHQLLRQYGNSAWFQASRRADELLAAGDLEGQRVWTRILGRINELDNLEPEGLLQ